MNRDKAFAAVRLITGGHLTQDQVDGITAILDQWDKSGQTDGRWLAYILATAYWETGKSFKPVAEIGRGHGMPYGAKDPTTGQAYYGRGFVQLTWKRNYERASSEVGVDLVAAPDRAMEPEIAAEILIRGMIEGWFTTRKLSDFINDRTDYIAARRVVNGNDRSATIGAYAQRMEQGIKDAITSGATAVAPQVASSSTVAAKVALWLVKKIFG